MLSIGFGRAGSALIGAAAAVLLAAATGWAAESTLVLHAGRTGGADNRLAIELAEILAAAPKTPLALSVEESSSSVQNVVEAPDRGAESLFTAASGSIRRALAGAAPFRPDPRYAGIRALFPLPLRSLHWVVRADSGVASFADLAGHAVIAGRRGGAGATETAAVLALLGLDKRVRLIPAAPGAVATMLEAKQALGFAAATAFPDGVIAALARTMPIRLLGLPRQALDTLLAGDDGLTAMVIPAGTYAGVDSDVMTVAMPSGIYTTLQMSEADAYRVTKAFWANKPALEARDPFWAAITPETMATLGVKLHPGALRYCTEAGMMVPPGLR